MDRFGRKATIQLGALICLVGATLQAAAQNLALILVGRILAGWAVGLLSMEAKPTHSPWRSETGPWAHYGIKYRPLRSVGSSGGFILCDSREVSYSPSSFVLQPQRS